MSSNPISLSFVQGDTVNINITWTDVDSVPTDLTGATITSVMKKEYTSGVAATFTLVPTDLANGLFTLSLTNAQTAALPVRSKSAITSFVWDCNVVYNNGETATPIFGYLKMQRQVTI